MMCLLPLYYSHIEAADGTLSDAEFHQFRTSGHGIIKCSVCGFDKVSKLNNPKYPVTYIHLP
jgi:hypothetical protein